MSEPKLLTSKYGNTVQAFPLTSDSKCNKTEGTITATMVHCVADGTIAVTFNDGSGPTNIAMIAGEDFTFPGAASISITSGTYHYA